MRLGADGNMLGNSQSQVSSMDFSSDDGGDHDGHGDYDGERAGIYALLPKRRTKKKVTQPSKTGTPAAELEELHRTAARLVRGTAMHGV